MIDRKKYTRLIRLLVVLLLLILPLSAFWELYFSNPSQNVETTAEYVGKETCIECHEVEYHDWLGSDHDKAMDYATDSTVLGDFDNASLIRNGQIHKMYKKDGRFFVTTDGEDGSMKEFEVKYVFGYFPLQDYLVEFPGGRLQTLALTWNSKDSSWFYMSDSVYQGMGVNHSNWLHWTNQAQNWNSMCADCHSTHLQKNYDITTDTYHTTWSEIDVSCESCHGPASQHLKWANLADYARKDIKNAGLLIKTSGIDNHQYVDNCARCHSRRGIMGDFDPHSKSIHNHVSPSLPMEPNWHIDGQIKEEDYVYASFLQSRMYMEDVQCNDCHNVHSGKLVLQGNDLCLQCHKANDYDTPSHTFHKTYGEEGEGLISQAGVKFEVGSGTQCINCHMHGQNFMGVDYRRDHSFRIPRPDLSIKNGSPNACNQCHKDKTNEWAQAYIEQWFGKSRPFQYGEAFSAAIHQDKDADRRLKSIYYDELYSTTIRSVALNYMSNSHMNDSILREALQSIEPKLRITAVKKFAIRSQQDLMDILPLLNDEAKGVRMEVISKIASLDTNLIPKKYREVYNLVMAERLEVLKYNADFPVGKFNFGNYYYQQKDYKNAEKYYLKAIEQDDELYVAKVNLSHLYSTIGEPKKAEIILAECVKSHPKDGNALYDYGLILSENRKYEESLKQLLKASDLLPQNARVDYNISKLYEFFGDKAKAEEFMQKYRNKQSKQ